MTFRYRFVFGDGTSRDFMISLDKDTLAMASPRRSAYPEWTRLSYRQCPNCPLDDSQHPHCPVAANIVEPIEAFQSALSHEEVEVQVEVPARTYVCRTSLQKGLGSMMGIYMTTSGCPILDKLRPMVDSHLPFATPTETTYRMMGMYLISQHFLAKRGKRADWTLDKLRSFMKEVERVNCAFADRLRGTGARDASINALVCLAAPGSTIAWSLPDEELDRLESIFLAHYGSEE